MAQHRAERLGEELKKELADIVRNYIRDPRIGLISFTDIEVTKDLRYAKVFFSTLGDDETIKTTASVLEKAKGYIRSELSHRLKLRYTPELTFKFDESMTYGSKISALLHKVSSEEKSNDD